MSGPKSGGTARVTTRRASASSVDVMVRLRVPDGKEGLNVWRFRVPTVVEPASEYAVPQWSSTAIPGGDGLVEASEARCMLTTRPVVQISTETTVNPVDCGS
jgi:hypothetical protein